MKTCGLLQYVQPKNTTVLFVFAMPEVKPKASHSGCSFYLYRSHGNPLEFWEGVGLFEAWEKAFPQVIR
jgi:hypothetical protein